MLVPSMNQHEIAAQIKSEYDKIYSTTLLRLGAEYDRERKKLRIDKEEIYPKEYDIKTAGKNNWIIFLHKCPGVKKYKGAESLAILCVVYYYSKKGLMVYYQAAPGLLAGFTSHFFKRYNERLGLNLSKPVEVVKAFFRNGIYSTVKFIERNNKPHVIGFGAQGLRFGEFKYNYTYLEWKTFVSRNLAFRGQKKLERELIEELISEMEAAEENECDPDKLLILKNRAAALPLVSKIKKSKPTPVMIPELKDFPVLTEKADGIWPPLRGTDRIIPERLFSCSYK